MAQPFQEFKDSLSADLNPEERAAALEQYAVDRDNDYRTLQSSSQEGVNKLKQNQEVLLNDAKKVAENEAYLLELHATNPERAEMILKTFGKPGLTIEMIKNGSKMGNGDDFDTKMVEYKKREQSQEYIDKFVSAIGFDETEKTTFDTQLKSLVGDKVLSTQELKVIATGIAFSMGKNISNNKNAMMAEHNVIPQGKVGGGSSDKGDGKSETQNWLEEAGVVRQAPAKT